MSPRGIAVVRVLSLILGGALGFGFGAWRPSASSLATPQPVPPRVPLPEREPGPPCDGQPDWGEIMGEARRVAELRERWIGGTMPWPTELPEAYRPDLVEASLARFEPVDANAVWWSLDCSGYPCILSWCSELDGDGVLRSGGMEDMHSLLTQDGRSDLGAMSPSCTTADETLSCATMAVSAPVVSADKARLWAHLVWRAERLCVDRG